MADVTTTTSALPTLPDACPLAIRTPRRASRSVISDPLASDPLTSYPRLASSSAIPLIPMPPIPTKWIRRVRPSTPPAPAPDRRSPSRRRGGQSRGPAEAPRRFGGPRPPSGIVRQPEQPIRERPAGQVRLLDHLRGAGAGQHLGVLPLMVVGRRGQRDEDRRAPRRRQLGDRGRAGA